MDYANYMSQESPPPEPTPSPPPPEPVPVRRPTIANLPRYDSQGDTSMTPVAPLPSPHANSMAGQTPYGQQFAHSRPSASPAPLTHQTSYGSHGPSPQVAPAQIPHYQPQTNYTQQYAPAPTPVVQHTNPLANYSNYQSHTAPRPVPVQHHSHGNASNAYIPPRAVEVYTLAESGNSAIPADIRAQFHHDDAGRIIFYTTPPMDKPASETAPALGHSLRYLADKARSREADEKKRKAREIELENELNEVKKRMKTNGENVSNALMSGKLDSIKTLEKSLEKGTDELYKQLHGENWKEVRQQDLDLLAAHQQVTFDKLKENSDFHKKKAAEKEVKITGFKWI